MVEITKVYVVTSGCYSDYHIVAVFTDEETAEKFADKFHCGVEDYELNPAIKEMNQGLNIYRIMMDIEGNTLKADVKNDANYIESSFGFDYKDNLYMYCWAKDTVHAVKITNEKRVHLIATTDWKQRVLDAKLRREAEASKNIIGEPVSQDEINESLLSTLKEFIEDED